MLSNAFKRSNCCCRDYQAALVEFKDWAIIYCTLSIIPLLWPAVIFGEIIGPKLRLKMSVLYSNIYKCRRTIVYIKVTK